MTPKIRTATLKDKESIKEIDTTIQFEPSRAEFIDDWLENDKVLVGETDENIVGYGVYSNSFFHQGNVEMLMIKADFRGNKIGEHIMKALEKLCDTPKLFVTTNLSNSRMQKLLTRMGYRPGGYIHELDPGDPELVYVKDVG